ncbi:MAG TPA: P27 family phage terminase small subunit [Dehalococcoidia bacterium]|nr:P27 family phage terminase small subunit [Dehalococcoidia bacterium]
MVARRQKPPSMLADRRPQRTARIVTVTTIEEPPPMPEGDFLKASIDLWQRFWTSPSARFIDHGSDLFAAKHWICYYDEWLRAMASVQRYRMVITPRGRLIPNPLTKLADTLEERLAKLEEKFGLSPLDRMRLGIESAEGERSLASLWADLDEGDDEC